jgi:Protein of unknown function (DUF2490)
MVCRRCYSVPVTLRASWPGGLVAALLLLGPVLGAANRAGAQSSTVPEYEYWPEVNLYERISENIRLMEQGSVVLGTDGVPVSKNLGFNVDLSVDPHPFRAYVLGAPTLVEDRARLLTLRIGYRYNESSPEVGTTVQNRLLTELTIRGHLFGLVSSDRNGFDWRWTDGAYSTRYRNRFQLERPIDLGDYQLTPYASAEVFYLLSSGQWNQIRYRAGLQVPIVDHTTLDVYGGYNDAWNPSPGQVYGLGFKLIISF